MQKYMQGQLNLIDDMEPGSPQLASAIRSYCESINNNRQSYKWVQAVQWIENILFGLGRQYIDDLLVARISRDTDGNLSVNRDFAKRVPRPVNDLLGTYVETNISLLTENRPQPRITAKTDDRDDVKKAELAELVIEYMWEALNLPEKHRELARLCMYCGYAFMETFYDPTEPRHLAVPKTEETSPMQIIGPEGTPIDLPMKQTSQVLDERGAPVYDAKVEFGDIRCNIVSPFELHFPQVHWWEDIDWVIKESYLPISILKDRYTHAELKPLLNKKNGWDLSVLDTLTNDNIQSLPIWWWERMTNVIEGPGPTIYVGTPELWNDHSVVRVFDRKPNPKWPRGRTVITVGEKVLYDSPKANGARAYDPRWPHRWHPYTRYRWEAQVGSILGRSLVSKLLPKIKRINAIDTTLIMWRRTVPIATWIMPKGTSPIEDIHSGKPGRYIEYDARKTGGAAPTPVNAPAYPEAALVERDQCLKEMDRIAGTEDVLRGERPQGVNSAMMLDTLRKQALSSRSPVLQAWDESVQVTGSAILQEVQKHVTADFHYEERLKILSREKASRFTIDSFSGADLSDNVIVRVDTASQAMLSKEARQERALEVIQYAPGFVQLPNTLQAKLIDELGWPDTLSPKSPDIGRAQILMSFIKSNHFDLAIPMEEDDAEVIHDLLVEELKSESFFDYTPDQMNKLNELIQYYKQEIERIQRSQLQMQFDLQQANNEAQGQPPAQNPPQAGSPAPPAQ
jgi:hypothetical protein